LHESYRVYVLRLEGDHFYVGLTSGLRFALPSTAVNTGRHGRNCILLSVWSKRYPCRGRMSSGRPSLRTWSCGSICNATAGSACEADISPVVTKKKRGRTFWFMGFLKRPHVADRNRRVAIQKRQHQKRALVCLREHVRSVAQRGERCSQALSPCTIRVSSSDSAKERQ